jgi:hypothetical protein
VTIDLSGDVDSIPRRLGSATHAMMAGVIDELVIDLGANARRPELLTPLSGWMQRNEVLLRTRVRSTVFVVPDWFARLQWRLVTLLGSNRTVAITARRTSR